jgi:tetratricopeptide (TPR) repeat protein
VLLEARKISLAAEQAFDNAQVEHDRPLAPRQAFVLLYLYLADDYLSLGRFAEALDALRYARILSPRFPPLYEAMAAAYRGLGDARGEAVARAGQALAEGRTPDAAQYCAAAGELAQALRDNRTPDATFELNPRALRLARRRAALGQCGKKLRESGTSQGARPPALPESVGQRFRLPTVGHHAIHHKAASQRFAQH